MLGFGLTLQVLYDDHDAMHYVKSFAFSKIIYFQINMCKDIHVSKQQLKNHYIIGCLNVYSDVSNLFCLDICSVMVVVLRLRGGGSNIM